MPRLRTIEESLSKRLSDSLSDITSATSVDLPDLTRKRGIPSFEEIQAMQDPEPIQEDKNMLEGLGRALWVGGTTFAEMSTFGLGKLVGIKAPEAETTGEKVGQAIGGALGFLLPFAGGKAAVSAVGRQFAGKASSKYMENSIRGGIKEILKKKKSGFEYTGPIEGIKNTDDALNLFLSKKRGGVVSETITKPMAHIDKAFKTATERANFANQLDDQAGILLKEISEFKGFQFSDDAAKQINELVGRVWSQAGKRPVSDIQGLLAKSLGDSKAANFYSHLFEEAVIFAGVENLMHGINVAAGEVEQDFLGTTAHAMILGHLLGGVRFIPGGIKGGTMSLLNETGRSRASAMVKLAGNYAKNYDASILANQKSVSTQYQMFAKMQETPFGGSSIGQRLEDAGAFVRPHIKKKVDKALSDRKAGLEYTWSMLDDIQRNGTKAEREAVTEFMIDGLGYVGKQLQKEWRPEFIKAWAGDWAGSTPRMLLGGLAMGNMALFDENVPFEDKLITFATGAFLMKNGKELTYRGADGSYETRQSLREFPEKLQSVKDMFDALSVDISHPLWIKMVDKVTTEQRGDNIMFNGTEPSDIAHLVEIANHKGKKDKPMFIKDGDAPVKISKMKGKKPGADIENIYKIFTDMNSRDSLISEGKVFKEWDELHPFQKREFQKLVEKNDIYDGMDIYDSYVEANTARFEHVNNIIIENAKESGRALLDRNGNQIGAPVPKVRSDGTSKLAFIPIDASMRTNLTAEQRNAITQYNAMLSIIGRRGIHEVDHSRTIQLKNSNRGIDEFTQRVNNSIDLLNENLGLVGIERHVTFKDGWLKDGFKLLDLRKSITDLAKNIEPWFKANPETSAHSRLLRTIYFEQEGLVIANKVKVEGAGKDSKEQHFVDSMHPLIRLLNESTDSRVTGVSQETKTVKASEVRELMDLFENAGITELNNPNLAPKVMFAKQVRHHYLRNKLKNTELSDGKGGVRRLDAVDIAILQRFIDWGMQNNSLTIKPIQQIMFDIDSGGVFRGMKSADLSSFEAGLAKAGITEPNQLGAAKNIFRELQRLAGGEDVRTFGAKYIKDLKDFIEPYMEREIKLKDGTTKKVGILRQSTKQEVNIPVQNLTQMVIELENIKTGLIPAQAERMLKSMREESLSTESEAKLMINTLLEQLAFNGGDPVKVYSLAVEHGLWNVETASFNRNLKESTLNEIMSNLLKSAKRDWGVEASSIKEIMESRANKDALNQSSDGYRTVTLPELIHKQTGYKLDGDFADTPISGSTHSQQIKALFFSKKYKNGKDIGKFLKDLEDNIIKNNESKFGEEVEGRLKNRDELVGQLSKAMMDILSSRNIRKLTFSQLESKNSTWNDAVVKESAAMRLVSEAIGEQRFGVETGNIIMIESSGMGRDGKIVNLSNRKYYDSVIDNMFRGDYFAQWAEFGESTIFNTAQAGRGIGNTQYALWRLGASEWAYGIEVGKIDVIAKNYYDYIKQRQKDGILDQKQVDKFFEENGIIEKDGAFQEITKPSSHINFNELVHRMMNDMVIGKIVGDRWFNENMRNFSDADMANLVKRAGLFNNISGNKLSSNSVKEISKYLEKSDSKFEGKDQVVQRLKELGEGKLNEVVIADEMIGRDGKLGDINPLNSIHNQIIKEYDIAIENVKEVTLKDGTKTNFKQELKDQRDAVKNDFKDASDMNSVTFVDESVFRALSFLFGATESKSIGGIKPIVLGFDGGGRFFVNKTAFVKNAEMQEIFKANNDVGFITFTSASKQLGGKYGSDYKVMENVDLKKLGKIDNNFKNQILAEDLNLLQIKGDKSKATLPPNHTSHFRNWEKQKGSDSVNEFYNYYLSEKVGKAQEEMSSLTNPDNHHSIVAEFRNQLKRQLGDLSSDIDINQGQIGVEKMWAEANGLPMIFKRQWENRLKQKYIDDLIRLKVDGGQGVLSPDVSISSSPLKQTLFRADGKVYQYGEVEIGAENALKKVDIENTHFIKPRKQSEDITISPGSKEHKQLNIPKEASNWTLGTLRGWAEKRGLKVAIMLERNPHTKSDSVIMLGLKGFRSEAEGNNIVVNSGDVKRALEGDYDIDTVNFWWNSPKDVFNQYKLGRGTVRDSKPLGVKQASYKGLNINSASDMTKYAEVMNHSDYIKGSIMNAQRIVQWLYNYNSSTPYGTEGANIKIGLNRYAVLKQGNNRKLAEQHLANLQQTILDAANGYDINTFKSYDTVMADILFGKNGIFEVKNFNKNKGRLEETRDLVEGSEQVIVMNLVQHYRNLMSLSNKIYEKGEGKKVGMAELLAGIREYDLAMLKAGENAYKGLNKVERDELRNVIGDDPYQGFHRNARFYDSTKADKLRSEQNMLPYDRLMAHIKHIGDMSMDVSKTRFDATEGFVDEIKLLTEAKDFDAVYKELSNTIRDSFRKAEISNQIHNQINDLYKLRNQYSNEGSRNYYNNRISQLKETRDKINKKISNELFDISKKDGKQKPRYKNLRKQVLARWEEKIRIENRRNNIDMEPSEVTRLAKKKFKEKGIPIESIRDSEVISALAVQEAFGNFAYRNQAELGLEGTVYVDMMKEISNLRKDFNQAWSEWNNRTGRWVNENQIYSEFLAKIDNIAESFAGDNMQMRNVMLARIMAPNSQLTKFGVFRGQLFPMPEYSRMHKYVNLGLRWNKMRNGENAKIISKYLSDAYSKAELRLRGKDTGLYDTPETGYVGKNQVDGTFFLDPFSYSVGHGRDMFLHAMAGNARILTGKNWSRLDEYQKLHAAFGSGLIRDIINNERMLNIPHAAVTAYSKYGRDMALNGFGGLTKAMDAEASLYISSVGERSVVGETFWEYESNMNFNEGGFGRARNVVEYVQGQVKKSSKEGCFK